MNAVNVKGVCWLIDLRQEGVVINGLRTRRCINIGCSILADGTQPGISLSPTTLKAVPINRLLH